MGMGMGMVTNAPTETVGGSAPRKIPFTNHTGGICDVELENCCLVTGAHSLGFIHSLRGLGSVDARIGSHAFVLGAGLAGLQVALPRLIFPGADRKLLVGVLWRNRFCADLQPASQAMGIVGKRRSSDKEIQRK